MKGQQAKAAPASPRLRAPLGHRPMAPFDFPSPPLSSRAAQRGGAELVAAPEALGAEAFASQPSEVPAPVARPAELAIDADLDPSAALLLRVSAAGPPPSFASTTKTRSGVGFAEREGLGVDNGLPDKDGTDVPQSAPRERRPAATESSTHRPQAAGIRFAGGKGKTQALPARPPLLREGKTQLNRYRRGN